MNIHFTSRLKKYLIFFFAIWILDSLQMYFFLDETIWKSVIHGFFYSFILNFVFYLIGIDSAVIYCKPEFENEIRSDVEALGFTFLKSRKGYDVYRKNDKLFFKRIRIKKTPFNIQISVPTWMDHPFDAYSQSHMKPI